MNKRLLLILLSAFFVASACSYLVYRVVARRLITVAPRSVTKVVVAANDIPLGSILRDVDLSTTEISGSVPKGAILNPKDAIGRGVISSLSQNEPVLESRLAAAGSGGGLAATISPGMRACAVRVDDVVGVAGFVTPGMRVDVLISGNGPGTNPAEGTVVKTLLQNIEVLSAGADIQKDAEGKARPVPVVNLLVTPEQAEVLSLASSQTHIQLVLRNPLDTQIVQPPGTAVAHLFTGKNGAPPPPRPRLVSAPRPASALSHTYLVQVYNGSKRSDEKFVSNEEKEK